jgi:hypothetical protein
VKKAPPDPSGGAFCAKAKGEIQGAPVVPGTGRE